MTSAVLSMSWMWYWASGNRPILSKQSWYSFLTVALERPTCLTGCCSLGDNELLETSSTWIVMMPGS